MIETAGPNLAHSLTALGLINEYRIYLHPVVLARARPISPNRGRRCASWPTIRWRGCDQVDLLRAEPTSAREVEARRKDSRCAKQAAKEKRRASRPLHSQHMLRCNEWR